MAALLAALVRIPYRVVSSVCLITKFSLASQLEKPPFHPKFPSHPKLKPFKCTFPTINRKSAHPHPYSSISVAICCGGFEAADPALSNFYPITTPTLHIIGKNDTIVTEERSRTLIRRCEDYRIEIHEGSKS
jgi:alpha-beta hydrolase superfamily lysophospholipase